MIIRQLADQGRILVEIVGGWKKFRGGAASRAYIEWAKVVVVCM
jgi:hypothetical protein